MSNATPTEIPRKLRPFTLEAFEAIPDNISDKKEDSKAEPANTSPTLGASVGFGEPLPSLKLGERTYFEDVCAGSTAKTSSYTATSSESPTPAERSKANCQSTHVPRLPS
ncbi:squamosa promoter-binding-like protein 12-like protein [Corchorus capsularis]|uniref:Squamosa promoter-binding-like protein 12-like protein n=1 Tax=Corchorus capsularis TaxID=210143 RepID=A0A1R3KHK3_COCAP|nr:squamosa promoter-binding-like protein 12-like protein [Corchorus capsularis]